MTLELYQKGAAVETWDGETVLTELGAYLCTQPLAMGQEPSAGEEG